ncbi:lipid kinase YegS [Luteimonas yindakuii]|uniref:lipid kinase YegS n=1 Tax=Luteimonas yindakuii TaxID=2565782 RepID=UPI0010A4F3ED|nr:lipid kinase YegS [Luteimonas yindakuii]QCO67048.1 lipid kinase YegS [Luteimonas yindakuii]
MTAPCWYVILNAKAAGNDEVRDAVHAAREAGHAIEVRLTWEEGDALRYVREALAAGAVRVIAGGGDGTLRDVAAALADAPGDADVLPVLGLLPLGTANDFATAAGVPDAIGEAFALAAGGSVHAIDLLRIAHDDGATWSLNLVSGGFGTEITVETREGLKKMLGGLAYLVTGIARMGRIEPVPVSLRGPGFAWEGDFIALGIGNGRQAGGGQALCPDAQVDDGLLDVTVVPQLEGEVAATVGTLVGAGKEAALDRVATRARLPWIEVSTPQPLMLNIDGEPVTGQRFRIDCVPRRLRVALPVDSPLLSTSTA